MHKPSLPTLVLASALLAACAAPQPLVTSADISRAESTGTLASLYNQVKAGLVGKDRNNKKYAAMYAQLDGIGRRLASDLDANLRKQVEAARMKNDIVPLNILTEVQSAGEPMRTWEPARHDAFSKDIVRETAITQKAIRDVNGYLEKLPGYAYRKRMDALTQMALLTGDSRYSDERDATLQRLRGEFEQARMTDDFEKALRLLDELPPDDQTDRTRIELQTLLFERKFNESLANDQPDEAYQLFQELSRSAYFPELKPRIGPTGNDMANYFIALGSNAVASGTMTEAYRWFGQARDVHRKLYGNELQAPEEKPFVDRMYRGYEKAKAENLWGLALGHLYVVQEFDEARANIVRDVRAAEEEVDKTAIRSAAVAPFTNASGVADYSGAMATKLTEHLFQTIPNDVRIMAYSGQGMTVDYVISGSIDEARVETSESKTRKTTRVVTESTVMVANPRYEEWKKLPERERKLVPQPPAQVATSRKEDVTYNVTQLRKVAYFSVAFRVIEAASGKVIHTDSLTLKRELSDEGNEGVDLGEFQLREKVASLPSDIEILNQMSTEASQEIGKRLAARVGDLDKRYAEAGKQAGTNGNPIEAAQDYAQAVSVAQRKNIDAAPYRVELKRWATSSGYAR